VKGKARTFMNADLDKRDLGSALGVKRLHGGRAIERAAASDMLVA